MNDNPDNSNKLSDEGNLFAKLEATSSKGQKNPNKTYNFNAIEQLDMEEHNPMAVTRYQGQGDDDLDNFHRLPTMEENRITQEAIAKTLIKEDDDGMEDVHFHPSPPVQVMYEPKNPHMSMLSSSSSSGGENPGAAQERPKSVRPPLPPQTGPVYSNYKDLFTHKKAEPPSIQVCDPTLKADTIGSHHLYKIKGSDHQGEFEVFRRFKQFDLLRRTLFNRFLGLYVPSLPEKKAMGKTDNFFVVERMYQLNSFMKEIAQLPYIYESQEFALFLRPPGDLEAVFSQLPSMNTFKLLDRLREVMPVPNAHTGDDYQVENFNKNVINAFVKESQVLMTSLQQFKLHMKVIVPIKEQEVYHYKNFVDFLCKYEDLNHRAQTAGSLDPNQSTPAEAIVNAPEGAHLKDLLATTAANARNPFIYMRNWVKQQIFELQALMQAITCQINVEKQRQNTIAKIQKKKETIEKLNTGKFTFKGLFKNAGEKANEIQLMLSQITQLEQDVYNYQFIRAHLIVYLSLIAIPWFKERKSGTYVSSMRNFCRQEVKNNQASLKCWGDFLTVIGKVEDRQGDVHSTPASVDVSAVIYDQPNGGAGMIGGTVFAQAEVTDKGE
ncbi:hypothetical protein FGO68_gene10278 [Halteria grandinella]|uniref:PX domain-containing protein n=1 Tax=Halteria grandinella TaxID=5974 RepID=A0A8J8NT45_HALGN|nr:hypothetical protein FGO68_gene10278 [Halteria grandinella]